jgi:hypothetical protein
MIGRLDNLVNVKYHFLYFKASVTYINIMATDKVCPIKTVVYKILNVEKLTAWLVENYPASIFLHETPLPTEFISNGKYYSAEYMGLDFDVFFDDDERWIDIYNYIDYDELYDTFFIVDDVGLGPHAKTLTELGYITGPLRVRSNAVRRTGAH